MNLQEIRWMAGFDYQAPASGDADLFRQYLRTKGVSVNPEPTLNPQQFEASIETDLEADSDWEIEEILDFDERRNRYKVLWKDYPIPSRIPQRSRDFSLFRRTRGRAGSAKDLAGNVGGVYRREDLARNVEGGKSCRDLGCVWAGANVLIRKICAAGRRRRLARVFGRSMRQGGRVSKGSGRGLRKISAAGGAGLKGVWQGSSEDLCGRPEGASSKGL
uniref:Uncharacterized protein n=1 Tax=Chromera velia CCMP2878 TaxID=1169474 RepID=A0A0G4GVH4_9ALVE|eukprot:Cvel_5272.t1-p1 / transcript=Cvel_5272.t1 / gene=Cvel_5272 / organism=Chromera_velia_CCMP2878 / gene_product=hypothetical protein / transcript_product=hypothetical protein / location=Cvel_scaffold243:82767-84662(+) / protein_length=217 / sequence_SO=supercontig / SO=protein_coding / is_pseudo=false